MDYSHKKMEHFVSPILLALYTILNRGFRGDECKSEVEAVGAAGAAAASGRERAEAARIG